MKDIFTCVDVYDECSWVGDNPQEDIGGNLCCPLCGNYAVSLGTLAENLEEITILINRIVRKLGRV